MATTQYRLRSKANKNVSIKIRLSLNRGNVFELNTGFTINPKDWSETTGLPKQNSETNKKTSIDLKKLDSYIIDNLNADLGKGVLIDSNWFATKINDCFSRVIKTDTSFLVNHIQYIIDNSNTRKVKTNGGFKIGLSASTKKNYTLFRNIILEYQKNIKKQIQFLEITKPFVDKFTNWLINIKKYSNNYSGKQLEILKTVCIDAEKNEIQVSPYSKIIQHFRENENDRYIQTLSFKELDSIKNVDFSNIEQLNKFKKENSELTKKLSITPEKLKNVRNWILLGCEIGQRGGDLLEITSENIRYNGKNYYIDIVQQKTNKNVTIGIIAPHVIDIIENQLPKKIPHQKLNEYLKVVCKLAGIVEVVKGTKLNVESNRKELGNYPKYELITSHCFRRSFASNYYKNIPTPILINITGHSKESLFLTYINKREDKDANADLFMQFYEKLNQVKQPQLKVLKNGTNN
ncbi:phage integrase SAM-like domain-containing protein [Flavobacterium sp.]|uniref:phage integrase SAM-like domain-containing protein n=1 Tax=Flavobacterium sp. TaxID=239 RepID=UPI00374CDFF4